jgi:hypothetical protein
VDFVSWQAFYQSNVQQLTMLLPVPALWLVVFLARGRFREDAFPGARLLRLYVVVFCLETILDPIATGPLVRALGLSEPAATAVMLSFVLLGDFRVYLLVAFFSRGDGALRPALREAALWTLAVPVFAGLANAALGAVIADLPDQVLWLIYEVAFVAVAAWLGWHGVPARIPDRHDPRRRALSRVLAYVAVYYALWATADTLILMGGSDAGWLLRIAPNQLYYAFYIPFVCTVFWRR